MGQDFISADEIAAFRGLSYTEDQFIELGKKLPDQAIIEQLRDSGMMLVAGPPTTMSLVDVRDVRADFLYSKGPDRDDEGWYDDASEKFAETDKVEALAWIAVRKEAVEDSFSKNWQEQQALIQEPMVIPNAAEAVWALTTYKAVRDVYLLENLYVRTNSVDSDGDRVYVGGFGTAGLGVYGSWGDRRLSGLGVSAARKF
ncbi:hypothetical protein [uncultured Hyphomicrobium sp.]|uniref:hypothetical protein n=1 Tax=uncultured Hyphomicrobium sp. TaxID=194373 RepID=UPI0025F5EA98|nr:hypothetical protein [uncultured Hyphomicrobium sp.]